MAEREREHLRVVEKGRGSSERGKERKWPREGERIMESVREESQVRTEERGRKERRQRENMLRKKIDREGELQLER